MMSTTEKYHSSSCSVRRMRDERKTTSLFPGAGVWADNLKLAGETVPRHAPGAKSKLNDLN